MVLTRALIVEYQVIGLATVLWLVVLICLVNSVSVLGVYTLSLNARDRRETLRSLQPFLKLSGVCAPTPARALPLSLRAGEERATEGPSGE